MEFSWSTFFLEIINFLVLVWILNRFLYRPVVRIIAERREQIASSLAAAEQQRNEGEALKQQYENRLLDWEREREARRADLTRDFEEERVRRREDLKHQLEADRRRAEVVEERNRQQREHEIEARALVLAGRFATRLLERISGPELERKLVETAVEDLTKLDPTQREALRRAWQSEGDSIEVTSAGALDETQRRVVEDGLGKLIGQRVTCRYLEDPSIMGGLRVRVGSWMLQANLEDELQSFVEAAKVAG